MQMNTLRQRKVAIGITIAFTSTVSFAYYCPPQYIESFVQPMFSSSTLALNQAIQAVDLALSTEMEMYSLRLNSAVAILTKQKAIATNQIADANRTSTQMTAQAMNVLSQTERVKEATFTYGGEFGQGYKPCAVYPGRTLMANRDAEMGEERRNRMMSEVVAAPGRYGDTTAAIQSLAKEHRDNFCTPDQVSSGMCASAGAMAGASLNVSTLFEPVMESDPAYKAKIAFVNNVVGLPDAPVPHSAANTPAAASYVLAKAQKDALMSPALASLKEIQLDYTGINSSHTGSDIPMAVRVNREVTRYLGNTAEYQAWSKVMVGQNSRGLLVEMLKVKALDLVLLEKQYRQYERMEANLATVVASEMRKQNVRATSASGQAARQDAASRIK